MKTFHLYERPDGRIVLSEHVEKESRHIRDISGRTWKEARAKIKEDEFFHDPGHGWFDTPRPGAYQRQREYHDRQVNALLRVRKLIASIGDSAIRPKKSKALEV